MILIPKNWLCSGRLTWSLNHREHCISMPSEAYEQANILYELEWKIFRLFCLCPRFSLFWTFKRTMRLIKMFAIRDWRKAMDMQEKLDKWDRLPSNEMWGTMTLIIGNGLESRKNARNASETSWVSIWSAVPVQAQAFCIALTLLSRATE